MFGVRFRVSARVSQSTSCDYPESESSRNSFKFELETQVGLKSSHCDTSEQDLRECLR